MMRSASQNEKDNQYSSERKNKKSRRKPKKFSSNQNVEERRNSSHTQRSSSSIESALVLGQRKNAWDLKKNAAEALFPNVESVVNEEPSEEEMVAWAISESMETAFLEKCALDQVATSEKSAEESPPEDDAWNTVQSNLPAPEPKVDRRNSDANNNKGLAHGSSAVPAEKSLKPCTSIPSTQEPKEDHVHSSEIASKIVKSTREGAPPTVALKFIDRHGRIDGCSEKHLFMGKGARFKEAEYLKQQQQQQQQQLESANESKVTQISSQEAPAQSTMQKAPSSKTSRASSQDSDHRTHQPNSSKESLDSVGPSSQKTRESIEAQPLTDNYSEISAQQPSSLPNESSSSSQSAARPAIQSEHSSHESRDFSRQASGSQPRKMEQPPQSGQHSVPIGRAILAASSSNGNQQRKAPPYGQSRNRSSYHDSKPGEGSGKREYYNGNDRAPRNDQFSGPAHAQSNRGPQTSDRNFPKSHGDPNLDSHKNSQRFNAEYKRSGQRSQRARRNSYRHDGEQNREFEKNERDHDQEYRIAKRSDDSSQISVQKSSSPGPTTVEQLPKQSTNLPLVENEEKLVSSTLSVETKEFHMPEPKIVTKDVPCISEFNSRYTTQIQSPNLPLHPINVPLPMIPPSNPLAALQPPLYNETNQSAQFAQHSSSRYASPPGFQPLERPAPALCPDCAPFEVKHANLRISDPSLYKLLLQKVYQSRNGSESCNGNSANQNPYARSWSCRCGAQLPNNQSEVEIPQCQNVTVLPEENYQAQRQIPQQVEPLMMNSFSQFSQNVVVPCQEPTSLPIANSEWNPANMPPHGLPLRENVQFVACPVESTNRAGFFPGFAFANVQRSIEQQHQHQQQNLGEETLAYTLPSCEDFPLEIQQQMFQRMMSNMRFGIAPGFHQMRCEPHGVFVPMQKGMQRGPVPPMGLSLNQYVEPMARVNFGHGNNPEEFHEGHYRCVGREVAPELGSAMRPPRPGDMRVPGGGRGRARLPQNN